MPQLRMNYHIYGQAKSIVWSPSSYHQSMADFAIELMRLERPLVVYQIGDMVKILKENGISRITSPDVWMGNFRVVV